VALRWLLDQPQVSPIPKASSHERRLENFEVSDFELSPEERAEIDGLRKDMRNTESEWSPDWNQ
jgi:2,5-diketo-D-gluconate reductase B